MAKVSKKTKRRARNTANTALPAVRVRMYRQGLGDCFLVTFHAGSARERHVLIDCGSLGATTTGVKIKDVVADIVKTTGGTLDAVVATHEHQDHLSGFLGQKSVFKDSLDVKNVWVAWTENPDDDDAQRLKKYVNDLGTALQAVALAPGAVASTTGVQDLLEFFGPRSLLGADDFAKTVHEAMELVRTGLGVKARYLAPETGVMEPDWLPGFRVYVLGPPRDKDTLATLGDHGSSELYGLAAAGKTAARFFGSAVGVDVPSTPASASPEEEEQMPFDPCCRLAGPLVASCYPEYVAREHEWRTIDHEYLRVTAELALQLDSMTNNTSLALAFERIDDGRVLLFPADAQLGNWLSWQNLGWEVNDATGQRRRVTVNDLLSRTVFYKVGHHGSHNATAKAKGLEQMQQKDELVAFIPVDRAVALKKGDKGSWKMPAASLYRRLLEKCQGRVVRSDIGWAAPPTGETEEEFIGLASPAEWKRWQTEQSASTQVKVEDEDLYFDYVLGS